MPNKINMIDKILPTGQWSSFDPEKHTLLGRGSDDDIEQKIKDALEVGYAIFTVGKEDHSLHYASNETDGMIRNMEEWLKTNEFDHNVQLYNALPSQAQWEDNVYLWFSKAVEDEEFKAKLNSKIAEAIMIEPRRGNRAFDRDFVVEKLEKLRDWLASQPIGTKAGSTGKRRASPYLFVMNRIGKDVKDYIRCNKVWKKKWK